MYRHNGILAKMIEQEIRGFSDSELDRVFANTIAPALCKRGVTMMLTDGLTMAEVWQDLTHCGHCHTCGAELQIVLDGEEWCPTCQTYPRYPAHGWSTSGNPEDQSCPRPKETY